jgi:hypothetical protein
MLIYFESIDSSSKLGEIGKFDFWENLVSSFTENVKIFEIISLTVSTILLWLSSRKLQKSYILVLVFLPFYTLLFSTQTNWGIAIAFFFTSYFINYKYNLFGILAHPGSLVLFIWNFLIRIKAKYVIIFIIIIIASLFVFTIKRLSIYLTLLGYSMQQTEINIKPVFVVVWLLLIHTCLQFFIYKLKKNDIILKTFKIIFIGLIIHLLALFLNLSILNYRILAVLGVFILLFQHQVFQVKPNLYNLIIIIITTLIFIYFYEFKIGWLRLLG